jgi:hypothetical protein
MKLPMVRHLLETFKKRAGDLLHQSVALNSSVDLQVQHFSGIMLPTPSKQGKSEEREEI